MPTFDANSLLSDPAPLWFDGPMAPDLGTPPGDRPPELSVVAPPAPDPLAQALPWLVRHLGVAAAVEAVVGPVDDERPAASDDVLPALRRIGFDAHLQRRRLDSFAKTDLPTILLLRSGDACVLTDRWQDQQGQAWCNLVLPGPQPDEFSSAEAEIELAYSGVALVVSPPRPPFASALGAAQAANLAQAQLAPQLAVQPDTPRAPVQASHADSLVTLAAALQGAQRAMRASRAPEAWGADLADPADPANVPQPSFLQGRVQPSPMWQRLSRFGQALATGAVGLLSGGQSGMASIWRSLQGAAAWQRLGGAARGVVAGAAKHLAQSGRQPVRALHAHMQQRQRHRQALLALGPAMAPLPRLDGAMKPARRLPRLPWRQTWTLLPSLAAGSALCLLVGAPQAWAQMVSGSSLQAMRAAPEMLRVAFSANLDEAAVAMADRAVNELAAAKDALERRSRQPHAGVGQAAQQRLAPRGRGLPRRARQAGRWSLTGSGEA